MQKDGQEPISQIEINGTYILAFYSGTFSDYDIKICYREKLKNGKWSLVRTPKHIHWVVDVLLKSGDDSTASQQLLNLLKKLWDTAQPLADDNERNKLSMEQILKSLDAEIERLKKLEAKGEYSIKFLILLITLLSIQEKTNRSDAYMFPKIIEALQNKEELFKIISTATHRGR